MNSQRILLGWTLACGLAMFGCAESPGSEHVPAPAPPRPAGPSAALEGVGGGAASRLDTRPPAQAASPPPAISGGNLLVTHDGKLVIVADSDRDRLVLVDAVTKKLLVDLPLSPGDEPGRLVEDAAGRVHVALRGGGSVVTLDLASRSIAERRVACSGPRGIAADDLHGTIIVACADGKLVTLPSAGGPASASVFIGPDLRDVIVNDSGLWVSTFKSAKLLSLDASGVVNRAIVLPQLSLPDSQQLQRQASFEPEVAWRAAGRAAQVVMLHQTAQVDAINLSLSADGSRLAGSAPAAPYGAGASGLPGAKCSGVVRAAFSVVDANGAVRTSASLGVATLPIDFDVASDGRLVVAFAGSENRRVDSNSMPLGDPPAMFAIFPPETLPVGPATSPSAEVLAAFGDCAPFDVRGSLPDPIVAVRFNPVSPAELFLLSRDPARLYWVDTHDVASPYVVELGGADVTDTGHALFHTDAGAGIACASCHPEGGEDGHVWTFTGLGSRRTQALSAGLAQTAPFHWDGALAGVSQVMDQVFVKRMGGTPQSPERVQSLEHWLFALSPPPPLRAAADAAAQRGAALFASAEVGCATCHSGSAFTNNRSAVVGTSAEVALQVPGLLGISHRAPFMHTGCAATLLGRFDPACGGGELHGHTAALSQAELGDLTAYLESL